LLRVSRAKLRDYGKREVNMETIGLTAFAFLAGLTVAGVSGSIMELAWGARLSLGEPFLDRRRVALSMCASAAAGPFMLVNDALCAREERRIGGPAMTASLLVAALWLLATGVLTCELAILIAG
jgi:hypothetical protein